jgi:hypothetical protein
VFRYLAILLLNAWDGYATTLGLIRGIVSEANPLLADMAHANPMSLFWSKLTVATAAVVILYANRHRRGVRIASLPIIAIYIVIGFMHLITLGVI